MLSKCCVGNYKKCRKLRYVVSLSWISKAEAPPTNMTASQFYTVFPELLDYFSFVHLTVSWRCVSGLDRQQWVSCIRLTITGRGTDVWQIVTLAWLAHRRCRPFMFVHCIAVRPNSLSLRLFYFSDRYWDPPHYTSHWQYFVYSSYFRTESQTHPRILIMYTRQVVLTVTSC